MTSVIATSASTGSTSLSCHGPDCQRTTTPEGNPLRRCPCRQARYCGIDCRKRHWPAHKTTCSAVKQDSPNPAVASASAAKVPTPGQASSPQPAAKPKTAQVGGLPNPDDIELPDHEIKTIKHVAAKIEAAAQGKPIYCEQCSCFDARYKHIANAANNGTCAHVGCYLPAKAGTRPIQLVTNCNLVGADGKSVADFHLLLAQYCGPEHARLATMSLAAEGAPLRGLR